MKHQDISLTGGLYRRFVFKGRGLIKFPRGIAAAKESEAQENLVGKKYKGEWAV